MQYTLAEPFGSPINLTYVYTRLESRFFFAKQLHEKMIALIFGLTPAVMKIYCHA